MKEEQFVAWAIVSLFGHKQVAGFCTEQNIAGTDFLRIDVPETKTGPGHTRFYGTSAIYSIDPVTEPVARAYAERLHDQPVESWDIQKVWDKMQQQKALRESEHFNYEEESLLDDEGIDNE